MPDEIPLKVPMPVTTKHPLRFSIGSGAPVLEKVDELKAFIEKQELHPGLKSYICDELDAMESNGAEICLHDVEFPHGGFDLHISCHGKHIGGKDSAVFQRKPEVAETPEGG